MNRSPLEFSRFWADLMAAVDQAPSADVGLMILTRLRDELKPFQGDSRYSPYLHEYEGRLDGLITAENLRDFSIDDHEHLRHAALAISLHRHIPILVTSSARLHAYVGGTDKAVELLCGVTGEKVEVGPLTEDLSAVSEIRSLETVIPRLEPSAPQTAKILADILAGWQAEASALSHNRAWCLLVQIGPHIHGPWGHLSQLSGTVDLMRKKNGRQNGGFADQVTFAHQLKTSDDPAIGGVYDSLAGVRKLLGELGLARLARERSWAVRLQFEGNSPMVHGDSLGLAAGLVTFAGLLKEEFLRHESKLSGEVGFTGGVDADGRLTGVNEATLRAKVERAFHSHLKYLVLPKEHEVAANAAATELALRHPRRKLHIVAAEILAEVIDNRNIVRPEKLCPAEYIAKGALKYSRATKVQVPLLAGLLLLLAGIVLDRTAPETWIPWGDTNPQSIKVSDKYIELYSSRSKLIRKWPKPCESLQLAESEHHSLCRDLDGDGSNEVLLLGLSDDDQTCNAHIYVWNATGELRWDRNARIVGDYLYDEDSIANVTVNKVYVFGLNGVPTIETFVSQSNPARYHMKFFDTTGRLLGTYVNTGPVGAPFPIDIDGDGHEEVAFSGTSVREKAAVAFVLRVPGSSGCAPPYSGDREYELSSVKRGNQLYYACFPATALSSYHGKIHNDFLNLEGAPRTSNNPLTVVTAEGDISNYVFYYLNTGLRVSRADLSNDFYLDYSTKVLGRHHDSVDWKPLKDTLLRRIKYWTDSGWVTEGALLDVGH